jgi:hypothetical protein
VDLPQLERAIQREKEPLQAYPTGSPAPLGSAQPSGAEALRYLRAGTLELNTFGAPATLPIETIPRAFHRKNPNRQPLAFDLGCQVSPARAETLFHSDGYVHTYHWLAEGERYWWFVEPFAADPTWLAGRSTADIVKSDPFARWGRVYVLHQQAGSAVVFPGHWPHRAFTLSNALGITGHTLLPVGEWL